MYCEVGVEIKWFDKLKMNTYVLPTLPSLYIIYIYKSAIRRNELG